MGIARSLVSISLCVCVFVFGCFQRVSCAASLTDSGITAEDKQSIDAYLKEIEALHKPLTKAKGVKERLQEPAMNAEKKFRTMDDSKEFSSSLLCQSEYSLVEVSTSPANAGELNIVVKYDPEGSGNLHSQLVISNVSGICNGGAIYDCQPGWKNCKYGVLEQSGVGAWSINHLYPSGGARPADGLEGCFCFSDHCGGTAGMYMEQIQSFAGQFIANAIAAKNQQLAVSHPVFDPTSKITTWSAGNVEDCVQGNVNELTLQANNMELDYKGTVQAQEADPESPWSMITKNLEKSANEIVCTQENRALSEWSEVQRTMPTDIYIGLDNESRQRECFYRYDGICGYVFGRPRWEGSQRTWAVCQQMAMDNIAGICNHLWVGGGHFTSIVDVKNTRWTGDPIQARVLGGVRCYGIEKKHPYRPLSMDCVGMRFEDNFICYSASKYVEGENVTANVDLRKYDGCSEVRPYVDGCTTIQKSDKCKLSKELTDGVYTIFNGARTGAVPHRTCKIIKGTKSSITVCEDWWKRTRTYVCEDMTDFVDAKERTNYVGDNTRVDDNAFLGDVGDITTGKDGNKTTSVIDAQIQFQNAFDKCTPTCVVQSTVPNYELVVPRGAISKGSLHVPDLEPSIVPEKNRTIINTQECELVNNQYTCPVPEGWTLRSQCSCGDGREFVNAITSLLVINQLSKDFICSTGQEIGQCEPEESTISNAVVCGNFQGSRQGTSGENALQDTGSLVLGTDYWECSPKLWTGNAPAPQEHHVYLDETYICMANVPTLAGTDYAEPTKDIGLVQPQKSWFASVIQWGQERIKEHLVGADSYWVTNNGCECGDFERDQIPICQPTADNSAVVCLADNIHYADAALCQQNCKGRATQGPEHICIWHDSLTTGSFPVSYRLGVFPDRVSVFGEVYVNADFQASVDTIENLPMCVDETLVETPEPFQEGVECTVRSETRNYQVDYFLLEEIFGYTTNIKGRYLRDYHSCYMGNADKICGTVIMVRNETCYTAALSKRQSAATLCQSYVNNGSISRITSANTLKISSGGSVYNPSARICRLRYTPSYGPRTKLERIEHAWYKSVCNGEKDFYQCPTNGVEYGTQADCRAACTKTRYRCMPSGRVVDDPSECSVPKFRCTQTNSVYTTNTTCAASCGFYGTSGGQLCASKATDSQDSFVMYLREADGEHGFDMEVAKLSADDTQNMIFIARAPYPDTAMIVNQCFRQYSNPFIKFDEPGTNAHFEYSHSDAMIYYTAIQQGELPSAGDGVLPAKPAVYRGSQYRTYELGLNQLYDDEVDDDGNIVRVPNASLTDEERNAIIGAMPAITLDEEGQYNLSAVDQARLVPRQPMFLGKKFSTIEYDETSMGRAGVLKVLASDLTSGIYYYECPAGVTNNTASCNQTAPMGGVAETIRGRMCFQYFCDDNATFEMNAGQVNGCGLTNDGLIEGGY